MRVEFLISFERFHDDVKIVRIGDIFDLAETSFYVLNVHFCGIRLRADLSFVDLFDVFGVHNPRLIDPPVKRMQIKLVVLEAWPKDFILIDQLSRVQIFIRDRKAILF